MVAVGLRRCRLSCRMYVEESSDKQLSRVVAHVSVSRETLAASIAFIPSCALLNWHADLPCTSRSTVRLARRYGEVYMARRSEGLA